MSFSFVVSGKLPPLKEVLAAAALPWPVEIAAATQTSDWPKGQIVKIADASSAPSGPLAGEGELAILEKMGLAPGFLLHAPGRSSRGVEVSYAAATVRIRTVSARGSQVEERLPALRVRILSLSSAEDYELAVRFAAAAARLAGAKVEAEHGPDGHVIDPVPADDLPGLFDAAFARKNALEMGQALLTGHYWAYTPRGWAKVPAGAFDDVIAKLQKGELVQAQKDDPIADLLFGAMLFTISADSAVTGAEKVALGALARSVPELRNAQADDARATRAAQALTTARSQPEWVRRKAYVLGVEAVTRGAEGESAGANLKAVSALYQALGVPEELAAAALFTARCKYVAGAVDDAMAETMVEGMLFVAGADGTVSEAETLAVVLTLATVPQFAGRDAAALLSAARRRLAEGKEATLARLSAFQKFRDKTVAMVSEVAFAGGLNDATEAALQAVERSMKVTEKLPANARETWAAKYAAGDARPAAATAAANAPAADALVSLAAAAIAEGNKRVLDGNYYFALLVTEMKGDRVVRAAKEPYLPGSVQELKALLATELRHVERYAIAYPALSFTLGGSVVAADAAGREKPHGVHAEQRYTPKTEAGPAAVLDAPAVTGTCESLIWEPPAGDAIAFEISRTHERQKPLDAAPWRETGGSWTFYECRLGEARFELAQSEGAGVTGVPGLSARVCEARLVAGSAGAARLLAQEIASRAKAAAPDATQAAFVKATSVVLSTSAARDASGFSSRGGSWICSKWTFDGGEVYVNLQPDMRRGELRPKEHGFSPLLAAL